ncbi:GntR family transcriptional regulator [Saccharopolyspora cebuensis]|uniref:GntR family transcriptional regulator n=1 Tax=Saccharopolyspora cebuensis TaxID=418759 RepID=A0ABV4CGI3_9PSEU
MAQPRHRLIADALREDIRTGRRAVGEALPSESALCRRWGVSRGPVRQALAALKAEGLITAAQGRPPVVRSPEPSQSLRSFTPFSRWARDCGREPGSRTLEVARRRAPGPVAEALGLGPDDFVVVVLRARYLDGEPVLVERSAFTEDVGGHLLSFDPDSGSITEHLTARGADFAAITHVLDAVLADEVDAEALGIERGAPLLRQRRTSRTAAGVPFEHSDDRYRPERVTFTITNALGGEDPRTITG